MDKTDIPGTFNAGATLGPVNETNMARIWNKHKQSNTPLKRKVFVAMSGGVDSSVAAALLQKEGYEVAGAHMLCWDGCENNGDKQDAMSVAAKLGIRFFTFDFRKEYRAAVYDYMVREYAAGRTPNPDVMCNKTIKFGIFLDRALEMGFDYIATGHYAQKEMKLLGMRVGVGAPVERVKTRAGREVSALRVARDTSKDQSYFLWTLTQGQLRHSLFPIGNYLKSEVRELARKFDLPTAEKKDSQGLCFVGKVDFGEFLREAIPQKQGVVVDSGGKKIGEHDGAHFYTLGQRHGLNIGGEALPLYIAEKRADTNTLVVARGDTDPILYRKELIAENLNWIFGEQEFPLKCFARIRYRQPLQHCTLNTASSTPDVIFDLPQRAISSGQSIVFYTDSGEMLGGGIIK
ncbi:MAG: tRNA 2-thiouridine(34) synthase MnmA [bacterium]|nr:tRNA 2-thiouridine(34) synthase MnmA [bacterium]